MMKKHRNAIDLYYSGYVKRSGDKVFLHSPSVCYTYSEVEIITNALARDIVSHTRWQNVIIPVQLEDDLSVAVCVLAILKANAAFVLVNPADANLKEIAAKHSDSPVWLVAPGAESGCPAGCIPITIDRNKLNCYLGKNTGKLRRNLPRSRREDLLAQLQSTSGTTGQAKVNYLQQFDICDFVNAYREQFEESFNAEGYMQYLSVYFAYGTENMLTALLNASPLFFLENMERNDLRRVFGKCALQNVQVLLLPAAVVNLIAKQDQLIAAIPETLKVIAAAGEDVYLSGALIRHLREKEIGFFTVYGNSEMHATLLQKADLSEEKITSRKTSIGSPFSSCDAVILDNEGKPVTDRGVVGTLYVSHAGKGSEHYHPKRLLNKQLGVVLPGCSDIYYNTRDLAYMENSGIRLTGRSDARVKIRGYWVALNDVHGVLMGFPEITGAYVNAVTDANQCRTIAAVYTANQEISKQELHRRMQNRLQEHEIPGLWIQVDTMPLNTSDKPDKSKCDAIIEAAVAERNRHTAAEDHDLSAAVDSIFHKYANDIGAGYADMEFDELGIDSLTFVIVLCEVEALLEIRVDTASMDLSQINTPNKMKNYAMEVYRNGTD